ncbi:MAG TPA: ATP-binding cassette domain-containing protein [Blastocatellia bacterium]
METKHPQQAPSRPPAGPVICFDKATLRLNDGKELVCDISFEVRAGETVVLLGRSGSGKTTTLKLVNALHLPTSGTVSIDGKATTDWDPISLRRHIGYVIQEIGLFPHFTIEKNVGVVPQLEGWPPAQIRERAREVLALVGLPPETFSPRYPYELSGGQRQRVGVARALAADPPIILMDEPFGALDPITRADLQREFAGLAQRLGKTIVFVTHDIREALLLATRIGLFKDGRLLQITPPPEFLKSEDSEARAFVESFREPAKWDS